jgi:agmatine/peptidylarginine deiminase
MSSKVRAIKAALVVFHWKCPDEDCEEENVEEFQSIEQRDEWLRDCGPVVTCLMCGRQYQVEFDDNAQVFPGWGYNPDTQVW